MSSTAHQTPLKMRANAAAAHPYCTAVALTGLSAEVVSFQRQQASLPPTQNVNSAVPPLLAAVQFGGNSAVYAANAVTTATKGSSLGQQLQHFERSPKCSIE